MKKIVLISLLFPYFLSAQLQVSNQQHDGESYFTIANSNAVSGIYYDTSDFVLVGKASALLAADISRVTGKEPTIITSGSELQGKLILIGTIGHSQPIDALIAENRIDVEGIKTNGNDS